MRWFVYVIALLCVLDARAGAPRKARDGSPAGREEHAVAGMNDGWDPSFALPGVDQGVGTLLWDGTNLYAGGTFTTAGRAMANYVARWDGTSWHPLGSGVDDIVYDLAWDGTYLYAGGEFWTAGGVVAGRVARWDGTNWSALGTGTSGDVYAVQWSGSSLYAGGFFWTAGGVVVRNVARWDGSNWSALGGGVDEPVWTLASDGTTLYAGGIFRTAGGVPANRVARWDGAAWSALGSGMNDGVLELCWDPTSLSLDAAGYFTVAGGVSASYVARWDGSAWEPLGGGVDGPAHSIASMGSAVWVGGVFSNAGGVTANNVAQWDGTGWTAVGAGTNGGVSTVAWTGSALIVGGSFTLAEGRPAYSIAQWNGTWAPLASGPHGGMNSWLLALAWQGTSLYAGGSFTIAGEVPANRVARRDGTTWSPLGSGMNDAVRAFATDGTDLYAGGAFTTAGGSAARRIARWDGAAWSAVGSGMDDAVMTLAWDGANLHAGGYFLTAGGSPARYVARWDGSTWSPLGAGMNQTVRELVWSGTELYAGGQFTTAGGLPANYVAQWNGTTWGPLGVGMNGGVLALGWFGASLYAGGHFTTAGGLPANRIARWDGGSWSPLANGMDDYVSALASDGTSIFAGGSFTAAGAVPANRVARWNGTSWGPLGSGVDSNVVAALVWGSGTSPGLYVGGLFEVAGATPSSYVGRFDSSAFVCPAITIGPASLPGGATGSAYVATIGATGGTGPYSFFASSGAVPAGLVLHPDTGILDGTPTTSGTTTFSVTALDVEWCTAARTYSVVICGGISLSPTSLSAAVLGLPYAQTITAAGGNAPYTFSVSAGALPSGLALDGFTGAISGTPAVLGTFGFTITAADASLCTGSRAYALVVGCPAVTVLPAALPLGNVGSPYSQTIMASGGMPPYTYALTGGTLPPGLTLAVNGILSGTPTVLGAFPSAITATDANTCTGSQTYVIMIDCPPIALSPPTLPAATVGTPYGTTFTAAGGTAPYTYAVMNGTLPQGLALSPAGVLAGTPTTPGVFSFTIIATDAFSCTGGRPYGVTVSCPNLTLSPALLRGGTLGVAYHVTLSASGGTAPYAFALTAGSLPPGLTLTSPGVISGTPTTTGAFSFTITATDAFACPGSRSYIITVNLPACATISVGPPSLAGGDEGLPYAQTLTASGGTPPYTWSVTIGLLPPGLALGTGTGSITGTPALAGTFGFTVTATDASPAACAGSRPYVVDVSAAVDHVVGEGLGPTNGNGVRVYRRDGTATSTSFDAYGSGQWGANVAAGDVDGGTYDEILTAPGPGVVFGPHVRGWKRDGTQIARVNFYAYGTLRYGANVGAGGLDGDALDEMLTGPGPGEVFGPHVRGFDVDGGAVSAIAKVNFLAYGTLKYGVNVEEGSVDGDGYAEILTGAGPGPVFAATVRGFEYDEAPVTAIAKINFNAFPSTFGVNVAGGDADGDGFAEIACAQGPAPANPNALAGFDYDAAFISPAPGFAVAPLPGSLYGGRLGTGDVTGDGRDELQCGRGRDPAAGSRVDVYRYTGATLIAVPPPFAPFTAASYAYGVNVAGGGLGYY